MRLLAQAQLFDQTAVAVRVARLQVVEQFAPARDHAQQPTARMMILDVRLEMITEAVDARRQQRDLHLGGTGVALGPLMVGDDLGLLLNRDCHASYSRPRERVGLYLEKCLRFKRFNRQEWRTADVGGRKQPARPQYARVRPRDADEKAVRVGPVVAVGQIAPGDRLSAFEAPGIAG